MELIEQIISNEYRNSEDNLSKAFYELCSKDSQSITIKKLFLKLEHRDKFTDKVLTYGLLGAIENNQQNYIPTINSFMEKNNRKLDLDTDCLSFFSLVKEEKYGEMINRYLDQLDPKKDSDFRELQKLFNYANDKNFPDFVNHLENKFSIIKNSMNEDMGDFISLEFGAHSSSVIIQPDGSLDFCGSMGGEWSQEELLEAHYKLNPILYNIENFNPTLLDKFLDRNEALHPSIVEYAVVKSIYLQNNEALLYLFSNEKTVEIIKSSEKIRNFINSDENWKEKKHEARSALLMLDIDKSLQNSNTTNKKPKI